MATRIILVLATVAALIAMVVSNVREGVFRPSSVLAGLIVFLATFVVCTAAALKVDMGAVYTANCRHQSKDDEYHRMMPLYRLVNMFFVGDVYNMLHFHTCPAVRSK